MGKFHNYKSNDKDLLSLLYPAEGCNWGYFSIIFDNYGIDVKTSLLLNTSTDKYETQISWNWHDLNYIGDNLKNKKQPMKKSIALHFARSIFVKENLDTNLLSTSDKVKVKIHLVSMISFT